MEVYVVYLEKDGGSPDAEFDTYQEAWDYLTPYGRTVASIKREVLG